MTPPRWRKSVTIGLLTAMLIVHNAQRMGVVPVFAELRERFGTDYSGIGTLFGAYVLGYALAQAAVGSFGDRYNARQLLLTGLALSALLSLLFAWTDSYPLALGSRFFLGTTGALLYTPAMKLGITLFPSGERGRILGTLQAGAGLGIVGALIAIPLAIRQFGMAGGFATLPLFTAAVLLAALSLLPDAPPAPVVSAARASGGAADTRRRVDLWQLLGISFFGMLASYGLLTWLPTYLTEDFGYSAIRAGTLASFSNIALVVAAPLVGALADRPGGRAGVVFGGCALALLCFLALIPDQSATIVLIITATMGASLAATTAPLMLFAGEHFGGWETARVIGWIATAAQLGATMAGTLFGFLLAYPGRFRLIWLTCALLAALRLALFGHFHWRTRSQSH